VGAGDWLICTAQVKELHASTGKRVMVVDRQGRLQWHEVFENNPKIVRSGQPTRNTVRLINAGGVRPYIQGKTATNWYWKRWNISPGELFLTPEEQAFGREHAGKILVEPNTKVEGSNKAWIWERWQELVDRGGDFVQVGGPNSRRLDGVRFVETKRFRDACAVLAECRAFVGTEGGLHHAAAALGKPAVVLFSEFISAEITGYRGHRNLRHAGGSCGSRVPCAGCRASMEAITVTEVAANLEEILA
jgi:ADP-heptose:LPS heptosyltransferase